MKPRLARTLLVALVTVAAGCGGGADDPASTTQQSGDTQTSVGGSAGGGSAGGNGVPPSAIDDFAVDIPDGWEIDLLGERGTTNATDVQLLYPADDFARIVDFYDNWTESHNENFIRDEQFDQVFYAARGKILITILRDEESRGQTWTLLEVSTFGQ